MHGTHYDHRPTNRVLKRVPLASSSLTAQEGATASAREPSIPEPSWGCLPPKGALWWLLAIDAGAMASPFEAHVPLEEKHPSVLRRYCLFAFAVSAVFYGCYVLL